MTTTATLEQRITWDSFLTQKHRRYVEGFRERRWKAMQSELAVAYHMRVVHEPCWTRPGEAVWWKRQPRPAAPGPEWVEWTMTNPFPVLTASQFAYHIRKGLRLRPPEYGDGVAAVETAPADGGSETEKGRAFEDKPFQCRRHGPDLYAFDNWDTYLEHCKLRGEAVELEVPPEVLAEARQHPYYCKQHNRSMDTPDAAADHIHHTHRGLRVLMPAPTAKDLTAHHLTTTKTSKPRLQTDALENQGARQ